MVLKEASVLVFCWRRSFLGIYRACIVNIVFTCFFMCFRYLLMCFRYWLMRFRYSSMYLNYWSWSIKCLQIINLDAIFAVYAPIRISSMWSIYSFDWITRSIQIIKVSKTGAHLYFAFLISECREKNITLFRTPNRRRMY